MKRKTTVALTSAFARAKAPPTMDESTREMPTVELHRRVLVAAQEDDLRDDPVARLEAESFQVKALSSVEGLHGEVLAWQPELLILGEHFDGRTGRQALVSLRASGQTFELPAAVVMHEPSVAEMLRWLRAGCVDVWLHPWTREVGERTAALLDECQRAQLATAGPRTRLLALAHRAGLEGTVLAYRGTPFEGYATFKRGELRGAQLGPLENAAALDVMLELEGGIEWFEKDVGLPDERPAEPPSPRTSVLVVEDEADVRALVTRRLTHAGYRVTTAADGAVGLQKALGGAFDVVVVDLNLPRLDGWGLLRRLREDVVGRESSVVVLSAQADVDALRAARVGARAYLHKSGHAKDLLNAIHLLAAPRVDAWASLERHKETGVDLRTLGAVWLVRALAELDCGGRLELEDDLGRYELLVADGLFLGATAQTGSLRVTGPVALEALLSSRGAGRFVFSSPKRVEGAPWLFDVVDVVCDGLRKDQARRLADAIEDPARLYFNDELAGLFANHANPTELQVLEAVRFPPPSFEALAAQVGLESEAVVAALSELLRRGVLSLTP